MKKLIAAAAVLLLCLGLTACGCEHAWVEADCEHPRTCSKCGEVEGESLGHDWKEADCSAPRTCARCGLTEGEALEHQPGEPELLDMDFVNGTCTGRITCTVCGEVLSEETETMTSFCRDGKFLLNVSDFAQRFDHVFRSMGEDLWYVESADVDGNAVCLVMQDEKVCAVITFITEGEELVTTEQKEERNIIGVACGCIPAVQGSAMGDMICGLLKTCDPTVDEPARVACFEEINRQMGENGSPRFVLERPGMTLESVKGALAGATDFYVRLQ